MSVFVCYVYICKLDSLLYISVYDPEAYSFQCIYIIFILISSIIYNQN